MNNNPTVEKALSASTDVAGIELNADNKFEIFLVI